jgi:hypothetical protein
VTATRDELTATRNELAANRNKLTNSRNELTATRTEMLTAKKQKANEMEAFKSRNLISSMIKINFQLFRYWRARPHPTLRLLVHHDELTE